MPCAFSIPAGLITLPTEAETLFDDCSGFHSISATFLIACAANFGVEMLMNTSAPARLQPDDVAVDRRLGGLVALLGDDHRGALAPSPSLRPFR